MRLIAISYPVLIMIFVLAGCTQNSKTRLQDDAFRHQMKAQCRERPKECGQWYQSIVFKTNADLKRYLRSVCADSPKEDFLTIFRDSVLNQNAYVYPEDFEYVKASQNAQTSLLFESIRAHNAAYISQLTNQNETKQLIAMAENDQAIRKELIDEIESNGMTDKFMVINTRMAMLDSIHYNKLQALDAWHDIDSPNLRNEIGNIGIKAMFYIVQHSDDKLGMNHLLKCKFLEPYDRFRLIDRIKIMEGKPQIYGTQYNSEGKLESIEDLSKANRARLEKGIVTIDPHPEIKN